MSHSTNQCGDGRISPVELRPARRAGWQQELSRAISNVPDLLAAVGIDHEPPDFVDAAFPVRVPLGYVARMRRGDIEDPLLRQVLPLSAEADEVPGFESDPVGDLASMVSPGLLKKYDGRALLISTGACAIHCRYCFRRDFPYGDASTTPTHLDDALDGIAADSSVREVILSGGDPLSLSDDRLRTLLTRIDAIGHIDRIRFHTRYPVVLPERIDDEFCDILATSPRPTVFVIHANHANEIDDRVAAALDRIRQHTRLLLNQSVLLRGVNDAAATLAKLSTRLFDCGVSPYYLHQLDAVAGAAHFAVPDRRAIEIVDELTETLSGYLVPKLVREIRGAPAKRGVTSGEPGAGSGSLPLA
jgi:EF-P beta-lysylation protein EpmB